MSNNDDTVFYTALILVVMIYSLIVWVWINTVM